MRIRFWGRAPITGASSVRELKDRAAQLVGLRQYRGAAEVYAQLIHIEPDEPQHRTRLGDMFIRLGSTDHAVSSYKESIELLVRCNEFKKAISLCGLVLKLDPEDAGTWARLAGLQSQRDAALPSLRQADLSENYVAEMSEWDGFGGHDGIDCPEDPSVRMRGSSSACLDPDEPAPSAAVAGNATPSEKPRPLSKRWGT